MVATLKTDVIEKADGSPVDLTGQSAAKAWVSYNMVGTASVLDSTNMSSLIDVGTGRASVSFTNSMVNADYTSVHGVGYGGSYVMGSSGAPTNTYFENLTFQSDNLSPVDIQKSTTTVHGALA